MAQVDIFVEQLHPKRTGRFLSLKVTEGNVLEVIVLVSIASEVGKYCHTIWKDLEPILVGGFSNSFFFLNPYLGK